ncbi:hypothetical protein ACHWQZ_G013579 [Mnemiopsis leidyi]
MVTVEMDEQGRLNWTSLPTTRQKRSDSNVSGTSFLGYFSDEDEISFDENREMDEQGRLNRTTLPTARSKRSDSNVSGTSFMGYFSDEDEISFDEKIGRCRAYSDPDLIQQYFTGCGNLIINYIPPHLVEEELLTLFKAAGPVENVKIVRKKPEGHSLGYAFVKYVCPADAQKAICKFNGYRLQNKILKVSVARPSCPEIKDANLYISGIPKHLTQAHLHGTFSAFGTIINCKIITNNGQSRGIGFVRYNTKQEALSAVQNLNRKILPGSSVPLQVKLAEKPSHRNVKGGMYDEMQKLLSSYKLDSTTNNVHPVVTNILKQYFPSVGEETKEGQEAEVISTTPPVPSSVCLYVFNLPPQTDRSYLFSLFKDFGEIASVRPIIHYPTMQCKGYGFVNMKSYSAASLAISTLHGKLIDGKPLQVSFKK